jgi:toxin HigB-1
MVIQSFRHKGLKRLFENADVRALPGNLVTKLSDMLAAVDAANDVEDVALFPGWRLHPLKGDRQWQLACDLSLRRRRCLRS